MKKMLIIICAIIFLTSCACSHKDEKKTLDTNKSLPTYVQNKKEDLDFMLSKFGIDSEELKDINVSLLINNYDLRNTQYTSDEVRNIISDNGEIYKNTSMESLYSIFSVVGSKLKEEDKVLDIAYELNIGTLVKRVIFDMEHQVFYVNDINSHSLSDEQLVILNNIPKKYGIYNWKLKYVDTDTSSTGNYAWKFIFYTSNDNYSTYSGFSSGGTEKFPVGFDDMRKELDEIINSVN